MQAWVVLPAAHHKAWPKMAAAALEALDAGPAKAAAKKGSKVAPKAAAKSARSNKSPP